jgi:hypothetical protein
MRRRMHLVVRSVVSPGIAVPVARADASFDGNYTGKRILKSGPVDDCPAGENVSVTSMATC